MYLLVSYVTEWKPPLKQPGSTGAKWNTAMQLEDIK